MSLPFLIIGAGGHGRVVADLIRACGRDILGFLDQDKALHRKRIQGIAVLGGDEFLSETVPAHVTLAHGIGWVNSPELRIGVYERMIAAGYIFEPLIHPRAIVAASAEISRGAQIMAGAIVQAGARIGENSIINTGAIVDHDCMVGSHCHVATGAVLCGAVRLGERCFAGAGSTIIQGIQIGSGTFVGAGALVVSNVGSGARVAGVPAKPMAPQ